MTAPVRRQSTEAYLGDHQRRIEILEAIPPVLGSNPLYAYLFSFTTPTTIVSGGSARLTNERFYTNSLWKAAGDSAVFSTGTATDDNDNTTGDLYLHFHQPGLYFVYADAYWSAGTFPRQTWVDSTAAGFNQSELTSMMAFAASGSLQAFPLDYLIVDQYTLTTFPFYKFRASVICYNNDGAADHDVRIHTLSAVYWPMASNFKNIPNTDFVYG